MIGVRKNKTIYFWLVSMLSVCFAFLMLAQGAAQCPPLITSLMPKNAVQVTGQYNSAGIMGIGYGAAKLPFENICINQVTKFPGKITYDIKHYSGDGLQIFKMQIDGEEQQRVRDNRSSMEKACSGLKKNAANLDKVIPLKTESVQGGSITYYGYWSDCSEGEKRSKPFASLHGVGHNDNTAINIEVNGGISTEAAVAAATENLGNFAKADFTKLDK